MNSYHISFFKFPTDGERHKTWLINCGLDDWVEISSAELRNKYLCSRHASGNCAMMQQQKLRIRFTLMKVVKQAQASRLLNMITFHQRRNSLTWNRD